MKLMMAGQSNKNGSRWSYKRYLSLLIFLVVAGVYFGFHSQAYIVDGVIFASVAAREIAGYKLNLFHPNHFIFNFLGLLFCDLLKILRVPVINSYQALQLMNNLFGLAGLTLFFRWLYQDTKKYMLSWSATLVLAFSYLYWWHSIEAQVYIVSSFCLLLTYRSADKYAESDSSIACWLFGVASALAILAHQSNVLLVLAAPFLLKNRKKIALYYGLITMLVVVPYLLVMLLVQKITTFTAAKKWLLNVGASYNPDVYINPYWSFKLSNIWLTLMSLGRVFWYNLSSAMVVLTLCTIFTIILIKGWKRKSRFYRFCLVLLLLYLAFFSFWNPGNADYLLGIGILFLFIVVSNSAAILRERYQSILAGVLLVIAGLLFANSYQAILPKTSIENNQSYQLAKEIACVVTPDDGIIIAGLAGYQTGKFYLPYFYNIRCLALDMLLIRRGKEKGIQFLREQLALGLREKKRIFVLSEIFTDPAVQELLQKYWQITPEEVYNIFKPYRLQTVAVFYYDQAPVILYQIVSRGEANGQKGPNS